MKEVKTKYMTFLEVTRKPKTSVWNIINNSSGSLLGVIEWYGPWRQYCLFTKDNMVFNTGCLATIIGFMKGL